MAELLGSCIACTKRAVGSASAREGMCAGHCETATEIRAIVRWYDGYEDLTGIKCLRDVAISDERVGCGHAMMNS